MGEDDAEGAPEGSKTGLLEGPFETVREGCEDLRIEGEADGNDDDEGIAVGDTDNAIDGAYDTAKEGYGDSSELAGSPDCIRKGTEDGSLSTRSEVGQDGVSEGLGEA